MESFTLKLFSPKVNYICKTNGIFKMFFKREYSVNAAPTMRQKKQIHPYKKIHPWKSLQQFSKELTANIIYNNDGLIALNKPYGISGKNITRRERHASFVMKNAIANAVDYTLEDAIPYITKELNCPPLTLIKTPEKYMSGIALLAMNKSVENAVIKSFRRTLPVHICPNTYWVVTTRMPRVTSGKKCLAITLKYSPCKNFMCVCIVSNQILHLYNMNLQLVIVPSWSENSVLRGETKPLNVEFKLLSTSTQQLAALIEMKASTARWHAIRLFAATVLYSPVLGDRIYGSRVKDVMGTWMVISPFIEAAQQPPRLNLDLLRLLELNTEDTWLIPAHIHLRQMLLPKFLSDKQDLVLTAPPTPEFLWTCERLQFTRTVNHQDNTKCTDTS